MECMYVWVCIATKLDLWPSFWRLVNTQTVLEFSLLWFGFRWYFRRALASLLVNIGMPAPFRWLLVTVQSLSHIQLFATPWTAARQASCPSLSPWACSDSCPLSQWYYPTISSSPSLPALNLSQHHRLFQWVSPSHQVAKVYLNSATHQPLTLSRWLEHSESELCPLSGVATVSLCR